MFDDPNCKLGSYKMLVGEQLPHAYLEFYQSLANVFQMDWILAVLPKPKLIINSKVKKQSSSLKKSSQCKLNNRAE